MSVKTVTIEKVKTYLQREIELWKKHYEARKRMEKQPYKSSNIPANPGRILEISKRQLYTAEAKTRYDAYSELYFELFGNFVADKEEVKEE